MDHPQQPKAAEDAVAISPDYRQLGVIAEAHSSAASGRSSYGTADPAFLCRSFSLAYSPGFSASVRVFNFGANWHKKPGFGFATVIVDITGE
jgi:hypothetical protein